MNATTDHLKVDVSFVVPWVFRMHIIAANALCKRKMYVLIALDSHSFIHSFIFTLILLPAFIIT